MTVTVLSTFGTLNIARTGMNAQQAGLNITGQNITNVNTDGYSRRSVILDSRPGPPTGGGGVWVGGVYRYTDEFASARLNQEETLKGNADSRSMILSHVSTMFNDLDDTGLGAAFDNFFGSLRLMQSSPSDLTVRQEVLARAGELTSTFNRISGEMTQVQRNIDNVLASAAEEVNVRTETIAELNKEIVLAKVKDGDISDLLDHRDRLVREIAEFVKVHTVTDDENRLTVFMEGGLPLVDGIQRSTLRVQDSAAPGSAAVEYVASNGQVSDITSQIVHGSMGGALEVRDTLLPGYLDDLDQLAFDFVGALNAQHAAGFGLDGVGARNLFTPLGGVPNAAANMSLDAAMIDAPEAVAAATNPLLLPGDNTNALALSALADQDLALGATVTFNEAYSRMVGDVGVVTRRAVDELSLRETGVKKIEDLRDMAVGVSLDEEMANVIQFQRAYQASARMLTVMDEIIKTVLGLGT